MPHAPLDIAVVDYAIAIKPTFGGEMNVLITKDLTSEPGSLEIVSANSGQYTPNPAEVTILAANPCELVAVMQARCDGGPSNIILTVAGTDNTNAPLTGTATFQVPGYANIQDRIFGKGFAVDVKTTGNKLFKSILSVSTAADSKATGGKIALFGIPPRTSFITVGCTTEKDFTTGGRTVKSIACGMDGTAFTKFGRSPEKQLNVTSKISTFGDGLARFDESRCTLLLEVKKEDRVVTDNLYLMQGVLSVKPTYPDGEGEATLAATGLYEDLAIMPAM